MRQEMFIAGFLEILAMMLLKLAPDYYLLVSVILEGVSALFSE